MNADGYDYDMAVGSRKPGTIGKLFERCKIPDLNSGLRIFRRELIERFYDLPS